MRSNNHKPPSRIRTARHEDAAKICDVLIRSVREICIKDHNHDEEIIQSWCGNKTPENVENWIADPFGYLVVAEAASSGIVGVAMYNRSAAKITLLYLAPEGLRQGLGTELLATLEAEARRLNHHEIELESTTTAREFYQRHGYQELGAPQLFWGKLTAYPMRKSIQSKDSS